MYRLMDWRIIRIHSYDKGLRTCSIMEMLNCNRKDNTNRCPPITRHWHRNRLSAAAKNAVNKDTNRPFVIF